MNCKSVVVHPQMDVPIYVQDGDSTPVRFEGCGFDSPTLGSTNPFNCSDTKASESRVKRVAFPGQVGAVLVFFKNFNSICLIPVVVYS